MFVFGLVGHSEEEIRAFRRRLRIVVKGQNVADPLEKFADLIIPGNSDHVRRVLLRNIEASGIFPH